MWGVGHKASQWRTTVRQRTVRLRYSTTTSTQNSPIPSASKHHRITVETHPNHEAHTPSTLYAHTHTHTDHRPKRTLRLFHTKSQVSTASTNHIFVLQQAGPLLLWYISIPSCFSCISMATISIHLPLITNLRGVLLNTVDTNTSVFCKRWLYFKIESAFMHIYEHVKIPSKSLMVCTTVSNPGSMNSSICSWKIRELNVLSTHPSIHDKNRKSAER